MFLKELHSFKDLTKHLTTRADDSHATPAKFKFKFYLELVSFYALYRIKPHVPLFVPNLSQFL